MIIHVIRCLITVASIKCYIGTGSHYEETDCITDGCMKTIVFNSEPVRACGSGTILGDSCKYSDFTKTTVCSCTKPLCNTGSNLKIPHLFLSLMALFVIAFINNA